MSSAASQLSLFARQPPAVPNTAIVLLGCGKRKQPAEWRGPLVDLYTGTYYAARLAVARRLGGPHWILSAFHGPRRPSYPAHPYERTLDRDETWRWYSAAVRRTLLADTREGDTVLVLAGRRYWSGWRRDLEREGREVLTPLDGIGIGDQMRLLKRWATTQHQETP